MKLCIAIIVIISAQLVLAMSCMAHPGSGIVVDKHGNVFISDINRGLIKFSPDGKVTIVLKEAGHWLAIDTNGKFEEMDFQKSKHWPRWFKHRYPPDSELRLISDGGSPLIVHSDGNLYFICDDEQMIPGGLQIGRLSPNGRLDLISPQMKAQIKELDGIKGLASGPDNLLYATCPNAVLKVNLNGTFTVLKQRIVGLDCDYEPSLTGLAVTSRGEIFLADSKCRCVLKLDVDGHISKVLSSEAPWSPSGLTLYDDDLYISEWTDEHDNQHDYRPRVRKLTSEGKVTLLGMWK